LPFSAPRDPLLAARLVIDSKPDAPADPVLDVFTQRCVWCLLPPRDPPLEGSAGQPCLGRFGRLHAGRSGRLGKDLMLAAAVGTMWRPLIAADALAWTLVALSVVVAPVPGVAQGLLVLGRPPEHTTPPYRVNARMGAP